MRPIAAARATIALIFLLLALLLSPDTGVPERLLTYPVVGLAVFIVARAVRNARRDVVDDKPGTLGIIIAVLGTPLMLANALSVARAEQSGPVAPFLFGFLAFLCLAVGVSNCRYVRATDP